MHTKQQSKAIAAQCAIIAVSANTTAHKVVNTNGVDMQKYWVTVSDSGTTRWYNDAKMTIRHRVGGPAVEYADGDQHWYLNGLLHRIHGPAVEYANGDQHWYLNGLRHREDGPAIEYADGTKEWWLNGQQLTEQEHAHRVNPAQEMTVAEIEKLLGHRVKIVK